MIHTLAVLLGGGEREEEDLPGGCKTVVAVSSPVPVRCPLHTPAAMMLEHSTGYLWTEPSETVSRIDGPFLKLLL